MIENSDGTTSFLPGAEIFLAALVALGIAAAAVAARLLRTRKK